MYGLCPYETRIGLSAALTIVSGERQLSALKFAPFNLGHKVTLDLNRQLQYLASLSAGVV